MFFILYILFKDLVAIYLHKYPAFLFPFFQELSVPTTHLLRWAKGQFSIIAHGNSDEHVASIIMSIRISN